MFALELILLVLGLAGHGLGWVAVVNRIHAWAVPRWLIEAISLGAYLLLGLVPLAIALDYWNSGWTAAPLSLQRQLILAYLGLGVLIFVGHLVLRAAYRASDGRGRALHANHTQVVDVSRRRAEPLTRRGLPSLYARLPGNELFQVHIHQKQLAIGHLPAGLAGLRIAHISDLHMSGRITRTYFEEVVQITNDLGPDLIAITGDLFDKQACFEWIETTYARLEAPLGVYFVLGNHDVRVDSAEAVRLLELAGLTYLGGCSTRRTVRDVPLILAGNELPWFPPAANLSDCPVTVQGHRPFRMVLSHSPDQFRWAQSNDVDLILAGHNHGGQIRFPLWGALFAPSNYGTRFDMGSFRQGTTVMHVSRGTGTHAPVRYNCPPEIALLELRQE